MKYLRVITVVVITFVFLAALTIGLGVIFAVKNINITIDSYTYSADSDKANSEISAYKEYFLDLYKGKLISSVSEEDIASDLDEISQGLDDSQYTLTSFTKVLPCTINMTLLERRETYVYETEDGTYNVYDMDGQLMRVADSEDGIMNTTGETPSPNVMLYLPDETYVETAAYLGSVFHTSFSDVLFSNDAPIRSTVEWIQIKDTYIAYFDTHDTKVIFHLRSGIEIEIYDYDVDQSAKMNAAYSVFKGLAPADKLTGYIHCFYGEDGAMTAKYEPKREAES